MGAHLLQAPAAAAIAAAAADTAASASAAAEAHVEKAADTAASASAAAEAHIEKAVALRPALPCPAEDLLAPLSSALGPAASDGEAVDDRSWELARLGAGAEPLSAAEPAPLAGQVPPTAAVPAPQLGAPVLAEVLGVGQADEMEKEAPDATMRSATAMVTAVKVEPLSAAVEAVALCMPQDRVPSTAAAAEEAVVGAPETLPSEQLAAAETMEEMAHIFLDAVAAYAAVVPTEQPVFETSRKTVGGPATVLASPEVHDDANADELAAPDTAAEAPAVDQGSEAATDTAAADGPSVLERQGGGMEERGRREEEVGEEEGVRSEVQARGAEEELEAGAGVLPRREPRQRKRPWHLLGGEWEEDCGAGRGRRRGLPALDDGRNGGGGIQGEVVDIAALSVSRRARSKVPHRRAVPLQGKGEELDNDEYEHVEPGVKQELDESERLRLEDGNAFAAKDVAVVEDGEKLMVTVCPAVGAPVGPVGPTDSEAAMQGPAGEERRGTLEGCSSRQAGMAQGVSRALRPLEAEARLEVLPEVAAELAGGGSGNSCRFGSDETNSGVAIEKAKVGEHRGWEAAAMVVHCHDSQSAGGDHSTASPTAPSGAALLPAVRTRRAVAAVKAAQLAAQFRRSAEAGSTGRGGRNSGVPAVLHAAARAAGGNGGKAGLCSFQLRPGRGRNSCLLPIPNGRRLCEHHEKVLRGAARSMRSVGVRRSQQPVGGTVSRGAGGADEQQCAKSSGQGWQCDNAAEPGRRLCAYHLRSRWLHALAKKSRPTAAGKAGMQAATSSSHGRGKARQKASSSSTDGKGTSGVLRRAAIKLAQLVKEASILKKRSVGCAYPETAFKEREVHMVIAALAVTTLTTSSAATRADPPLAGAQI
eukprot:SM000124S25932  [mRNA]  locus=s124:112062:116029:- [translate_table: standard]